MIRPYSANVSLAPCEGTTLIYSENAMIPCRHVVCNRGSALQRLGDAACSFEVALFQTRALNQCRGRFNVRALRGLIAERRGSARLAVAEMRRALLAARLGFLC